jgi:hypothetical protein
MPWRHPYPTRLLAARVGELLRSRDASGVQHPAEQPGRAAREVQLLPGSSAGPAEAMVLGLHPGESEVRVELKLSDGSDAWARVGTETAHLLELREGQILPVRPPAVAAS